MPNEKINIVSAEQAAVLRIEVLGPESGSRYREAAMDYRALRGAISGQYYIGSYLSTHRAKILAQEYTQQKEALKLQALKLAATVVGLSIHESQSQLESSEELPWLDTKLDSR